MTDLDARLRALVGQMAAAAPPAPPLPDRRPPRRRPQRLMVALAVSLAVVTASVVWLVIPRRDPDVTTLSEQPVTASCPGQFDPASERTREWFRRPNADGLPERGTTTRLRVLSAIDDSRVFLRDRYQGVESVDVGGGWGVTFSADRDGEVSYHREPDYMAVVTLAQRADCPSGPMAMLFLDTPQGRGVPVLFRYRTSRYEEGATRSSVLVAADGAMTPRFLLIDLDSGGAQQVRLPGLARWANQFYPVVHTARRLVYLEEDERRSFPSSDPSPRVFSLPDTFTGRPVELGRADALVPSETSGMVWLVKHVTDRFDSVVREVEAKTGDGDPREWRVDGEPVIGVQGGLLLHRAEPNRERLVLWRPGDPETQATVASSRALLFAGIEGNTVVVGVDCDEQQTCEGLKLIDMVTRDERVVPRPEGVSRWVVGQDISRTALAPTGRHLVIAVKDEEPKSNYYPRVVIDLEGRVLRRFDEVAASSLWSPDGRWAVVQLLDSIVVFRPDDGVARSVSVKYEDEGSALITAPTW